MSVERSPYTTPDAEVKAPPEEGVQLADRGTRLGGAIIDGLLVALPVFSFMYWSGIFSRLSEGQNILTDTLTMGAVGFGSFLVIHGYLLSTSGQTVAKRLLGMQIVSVDDERVPPFAKLIGLRYLPFFVAGQVPVLGNFVGLIDPLTIFGKQRRCLHDYLAGTKVIKVAEPVEPWD